MINRYLIYERYEYWSKEGKTWTDWFLTFNSPYTKTEQEATTFLKEMKKFAADFDKHTKLKHEFKIQLVDVETLLHPQIKYSKKGRPSKKEIERCKYEFDNYCKLFIEEYDRRNDGCI